MVGFSQGAPFALACAAAGVVPRLALVSFTDELASPHLRAMLPPDLQSMIDLVARDPHAAEARFAGMTARHMHDLVYQLSAEVDRVVYAAPSFDRAFRAALEEGFCQGAEGYARDTVLTLSPWPFDVARVRVSVDLWVGSLDASPVHSPDGGRRLAERLPAARRHVREAGGSLLWTHDREILEGLLTG